MRYEIPKSKVVQEAEKEEANESSPSVRISQRTTKEIPPRRLIEEINVAQEFTEPKSYNEAISCKYKENWLKAMEEEFTSFEENRT